MATSVLHKCTTPCQEVSITRSRDDLWGFGLLSHSMPCHDPLCVVIHVVRWLVPHHLIPSYHGSRPWDGVMEWLCNLSLTPWHVHST